MPVMETIFTLMPGHCIQYSPGQDLPLETACIIKIEDSSVFFGRIVTDKSISRLYEDNFSVKVVGRIIAVKNHEGIVESYTSSKDEAWGTFKLIKDCALKSEPGFPYFPSNVHNFATCLTDIELIDDSHSCQSHDISALTYHPADDVDIVDLSSDESNYTIITQPSHSDFCGPAQSIQVLYGDAGVGIDGSNPVGKAALPHKAEVEEVLDHDVARSDNSDNDNSDNDVQSIVTRNSDKKKDPWWFNLHEEEEFVKQDIAIADANSFDEKDRVFAGDVHSTDKTWSPPSSTYAATGSLPLSRDRSPKPVSLSFKNDRKLSIEFVYEHGTVDEIKDEFRGYVQTHHFHEFSPSSVYVNIKHLKDGFVTKSLTPNDLATTNIINSVWASSAYLYKAICEIPGLNFSVKKSSPQQIICAVTDCGFCINFVPIFKLPPAPSSLLSTTALSTPRNGRAQKNRRNLMNHQVRVTSVANKHNHSLGGYLNRTSTSSSSSSSGVVLVESLVKRCLKKEKDTNDGVITLSSTEQEIDEPRNRKIRSRRSSKSRAKKIPFSILSSAAPVNGRSHDDYNAKLVSRGCLVSLFHTYKTMYSNKMTSNIGRQPRMGRKYWEMLEGLEGAIDKVGEFDPGHLLMRFDSEEYSCLSKCFQQYYGVGEGMVKLLAWLHSEQPDLSTQHFVSDINWTWYLPSFGAWDRKNPTKKKKRKKK